MLLVFRPYPLLTLKSLFTVTSVNNFFTYLFGIQAIPVFFAYSIIHSWFSDDKIILRTITVILPVKIMISNGKKIDTGWCFKFKFLCVIFLSSIFCCSLRLNNDTSPEEKARAISLSKVRCYRSAFLVMFITFSEVSSRILRMLPPACHKICQV